MRAPPETHLDSCAAHAGNAPTKAVQKCGTMVKSTTASECGHATSTIANRQAEIMLRIASEFGFTPASRSRIATPSPVEPTLFDRMDPSPEEPTS